MKYSLERLPASDWGGDWKVLDRVEVNGTYGGTIHLKQAFAPFMMTGLAGSSGFILSAKAMEKVGGKFPGRYSGLLGPTS